jgi:prephenate dehydratase
MTTAFLGPAGTFSEDAALAWAGPEANLIPLTSIPALTSAVETGLADDAVLPIENSIEGSIHTTLDLLIHETPLRIKAELVIPVRLFLMTAPGAVLSDIQTVTTHSNPLGQSRRFLERVLPNARQVPALSTAAAVQQVVNGGDKSVAAIGTERSAELFGATIIARDIQDVKTNVTRFVVIGQQDAAPTGKDKTSIAFTMDKDVPGSLNATLTPFAKAGIQLTKIESRPTKAWLGEYVFLIDFLGHRLDPEIAPILEELRGYCQTLKVFGSYPRFPVERFRDLAG